jgi:acylphosphatase
MVRGHIIVDGSVQGVSFRWWTKRVAMKLGIVGWVKNLEDGRVEIIAEAEKERLESLIDMLKKGPFFSKVEGVDVNWEKSTGQYHAFTIEK